MKKITYKKLISARKVFTYKKLEGSSVESIIVSVLTDHFAFDNPIRRG